MMRIITLIILTSLLSVIPANAQTIDKKLKHVRDTAIKIVAESKHHGEIKLKSGEKLSGEIVSVETDSLTFVDSKSLKSQQIAFSEVDEIKVREKGLGKGVWMAIGIGMAAVLVVALLPRTECCNEQSC